MCKRVRKYARSVRCFSGKRWGNNRPRTQKNFCHMFIVSATSQMHYLPGDRTATVFRELSLELECLSAGCKQRNKATTMEETLTASQWQLLNSLVDVYVAC